MEITILGEYLPFGHEAESFTTASAGNSSVRQPGSERTLGYPPFSSSPKQEQLPTRGNVVLPRYHLHPPTQDGDIFDPDTQTVSHGYDVELVVQGYKVLWTQGSVLRKVLDFESENEPIIQTLFAWFAVIANPPRANTDQQQLQETPTQSQQSQQGQRVDNSASPTDSSQSQQQGKRQALVVIFRDIAKMYFHNGETHSVYIPFRVKKAWAMDLGLLFERQSFPEEHLPDNEEYVPLFYSIMDPFAEFKVVASKPLPLHPDHPPPPPPPLPPTSLANSGNISSNAPPVTMERLPHDNSPDFVAICNTLVFLTHLDVYDKIGVTYDTYWKRHRVWRYITRIQSSLPYSTTTNSQVRGNEESSMDMEVDDDLDPDLQMRSETFMLEIESVIFSASQNSTVFTAHAQDGSTVVCIFDQDTEKLSCYQHIAGEIIAHLWTRPAKAAISMIATRRRHRDILLMALDSTLLLWTGFANELIPCKASFPPGFLEPTQSLSSSSLVKKTAADYLLGGLKLKGVHKRDAHIVEMRDSVENRISLVLSNSKIVRVQMDFQVRSSLVQESLDAISFALPVDLLWDFKHRFLQLQFSREPKYDVVPATDEWGNFSTTLLSFCDPSFYPPVLSSPTMPTRSLPSALPKKSGMATSLSSSYSAASFSAATTTAGAGVSTAISEADWNFFLESETHKLLEDHPSFRGSTAALPTLTTNPYTEMIMQAQRLATVHFRGPATRQSLRLDTFFKYVLVALHLVQEDRSLNLMTCQEGSLEPLLMLLAHMVNWNTWVDFYARRSLVREKCLVVPEVYMEGSTMALEEFDFDPPDIYRWISDMVSSSSDIKPFPTLSHVSLLRDPNPMTFVQLSSPPCDQTRKITLFYSALMERTSLTTSTNTTTGDTGTKFDGDQSVVRAIVAEQVTENQLDQLPFGVSLPLREALWRCRRNPSPDLNSKGLSFIGRDDLAELESSHQSPGYFMKPISVLQKREEPTKKQDVHSLCEDVVHQEGGSERELLESTGTEIIEAEITNLRFGADTRVAETQKMLQSSVVVQLKAAKEESLPEPPSEEDLKVIHQEMLRKLAQRTLALPIGRAILTFGTATPILTQKAPIPEIELKAKLLAPSTLGVISLEPGTLTSSSGGTSHHNTNSGNNGQPGDEILEWSHFHNGVAAGLRISPNSRDVNDSWIIYNRPKELNSTHAGFLLALGLTGHLRVLVRPHLLKYLTAKHEMTSTGLLLGLACAYRGTMDTTVTKLLSVHIPALLPQHASELNLSYQTQVACVVGIGLIYMETSHRRMAEIMLAEIGRLSSLAWAASSAAAAAAAGGGGGPGAIDDGLDFLSARTDLQECHSLASGFALGFITLGQGNKSMGLRDMKIVDVLVGYMPGSTDRNHGQTKNPSLLYGNGPAYNSDMSNPDGQHGSLYNNGSHGNGPGQSQPNGNSSTNASKSMNRRIAGVDKTSAGATVAMGLMYLKTNSKPIADKLAVPETPFLLDYVTPDTLMLRVICRAIVLWDSIVPTKSWILGQVPEYLKGGEGGPPTNTKTGPQSYYSILAGACFAIGLRFAGSGIETAYQCLLEHVDMFMELGRESPDGSYEDSITKSTLRTCLDVSVLACAMVAAGSGRIDFLQRIRKLHRRVHTDVSYGSHMAYHMALGLLFLGGGGYTLGTSHRSVAVLLCSLYPRLPSDPGDNRSHLQAFRHLWVLAVEPRCLVTRDASLGGCCPVPVRVHLKPAYCQTPANMGPSLDQEDEQQPQDLNARRMSIDSQGLLLQQQQQPSLVVYRHPSTLYSSSKLDMMTPCLLPELDVISKIEILGPRYWPITLDLNEEEEDDRSELDGHSSSHPVQTGGRAAGSGPKHARIWRILKSRSISVMRHLGHLSYSEDPYGMRGILARPFPKVLVGENQVQEANLPTLGVSARGSVGQAGRIGEGGKDQGFVMNAGGSRSRKRQLLEMLAETSRKRQQKQQRQGLDPQGLNRPLAINPTEAEQGDQGGFSGTGSSSVSYGEDFCLTFLQDSQVAAFASYLCRAHPSRPSRLGSSSGSGSGGRGSSGYYFDSGPEDDTETEMKAEEAVAMEAEREEARAMYFTNVLYECLTMDKVEVLGAHVWLYEITRRLEDQEQVTWRTLWELRILMNYYDTQYKRHYLASSSSKSSVHGSLAVPNSTPAAGGGRRKNSSAMAGPVVMAKMMEDDGSETLIKVSRITELVAKILKRAEPGGGGGGDVGGDQGERLDRGEVDQVSEDARYYFNHGTFRPRKTPVDEQQSRPARQRGQPPPPPPQHQGVEPTRLESKNDLDWFKVWLVMNDVPGPDAIQAMKAILEEHAYSSIMGSGGFGNESLVASSANTTTAIATSSGGHAGQEAPQGGGRTGTGNGGGHDRSRQERDKKETLLCQLFSVAFPNVSLKVLEYLMAPLSDANHNNMSF